MPCATREPARSSSASRCTCILRVSSKSAHSASNATSSPRACAVTSAPAQRASLPGSLPSGVTGSNFTCSWPPVNTCPACTAIAHHTRAAETSTYGRAAFSSISSTSSWSTHSWSPSASATSMRAAIDAHRFRCIALTCRSPRAGWFAGGRTRVASTDRLPAARTARPPRPARPRTPRLRPGPRPARSRDHRPREVPERVDHVAGGELAHRRPVHRRVEQLAHLPVEVERQRGEHLQVELAGERDGGVRLAQRRRTGREDERAPEPLSPHGDAEHRAQGVAGLDPAGDAVAVGHGELFEPRQGVVERGEFDGDARGAVRELAHGWHGHALFLSWWGIFGSVARRAALWSSPTTVPAVSWLRSRAARSAVAA